VLAPGRRSDCKWCQMLKIVSKILAKFHWGQLNDGADYTPFFAHHTEVDKISTDKARRAFSLRQLSFLLTATNLYEDVNRSDVWTHNFMVFRLGHRGDTVGFTWTSSCRSLYHDNIQTPHQYISTSNTHTRTAASKIILLNAWKGLASCG